MSVLLVMLWIGGAAGISFAIRSNLRTSLLPTTIWVGAAWVSVGTSLLHPTMTANYIALSLVAAAGISVLGARWPGAAAWQFVVFGLLGVTLLPLVEAELLGKPLTLSGIRLAFVIGLLGTAVVNFLPTRLGLCAALVGTWAALALADRQSDLGQIAIAATPIVGWLSIASRRSADSESNRLWRSFRDRFGAIWSLRVREQFNRSAVNAGSATTLQWRGLNGPDGSESYERLRAVLKRFGMPPT